MDAPDGIQTNGDSGQPFSIGLAEYAVALYMHTIVKQESDPLEVTIIAPNSLQRDLVKEVYAKKQAAVADSRFANISPHVVSYSEELMASLPLEVAIYCELGDDHQHHTADT